MKIDRQYYAVEGYSKGELREPFHQKNWFFSIQSSVLVLKKIKFDLSLILEEIFSNRCRAYVEKSIVLHHALGNEHHRSWHSHMWIYIVCIMLHELWSSIWR